VNGFGCKTALEKPLLPWITALEQCPRVGKLDWHRFALALITFSGERIKVIALGKEDIIIMKLMAGREKDKKHIRYLLNLGADTIIVENALYSLKGSYGEKVDKALELLDEVENED
jgi:hypothetical protein